MAAARIQALFASEFAVRRGAGHDIKDSGWQPTDSSLAMLHERAGSRNRGETARVQPFLRGLATRLDDEAFMQLTRAVCQTWQQRYRADRTPLVLDSVAEVASLAGGVSPPGSSVTAWRFGFRRTRSILRSTSSR